MKKSLALVLSLILIVGILPVGAFAAGNVKEYTSCCILGDSNAVGFGLDDYWEDLYNGLMDERRLVEGSFAQLFTEELGMDRENVLNHGHSGFRTQEILRILDREVVLGETGKYIDEKGDFFLTSTGSFAPIFYELFPNIHDKMTNDIKNSDVIMLCIGGNDIFTGAMFATLESFVEMNDEYGYLLDPSTGRNLCQRFADMLNAAKAMGNLSEIIAETAVGIEKGYRNFVKYMPELLDKIEELNPTAPVIVYSVTNPFLVIDELLPVDVYDYFDLMTSRANIYLRTLCGGNLIYTDVSDNTMFGLSVFDYMEEQGYYYVFIMMTHPSAEGHRYMADQALAALAKYDNSPANLKLTKTKLAKTNTLTWDRTKNAAAYRVYRATNENGSYSYIGSVVTTRFIDLTAKRNGTYYYKVQAVYLDGSTTCLSDAVK